ncbi:DUF6443 domain-containing protein [Moheibacter sp.]|uniref:DUF6443 domain-containing protein n=1 Tax=Moheibacter sp. TaxID=1965316 RepID=UPI003C76BDBD
MRLYTLITIFSLASLLVFGQSSGENYIKSTEYLTDDGDEKIITIQYFDGLGRTKQLKQIGASPNPSGAPGDLVIHFEYDGFGRQVKDHLPVPVASTTQEITTDVLSKYTTFYATQYGTNAYFSEKTIENSPLNRVMSQAAPGNHWSKGSGHEIEFEYKTNGLNEVKRFKVSLSGNNDPTLIPDGHYEINQLYKTITIDENGNKIHEFKDKQGRVVLKRSFVANGMTAGKSIDPDAELLVVADTYYVYDIYGNLTYVIPPLASAKTNPNDVLAELCYQYKYDERNRLVEKQLPGKGAEYMVYDKQDRLVATQDANMRVGSARWLFTKYDKFGRVVYTGIVENYSDRASLQQAVNGMGNNSEDRMTSSQFTLNGQQVHYTRNKAFPVNNEGSELFSVNYYDYYGTINMNGAPTPDAPYRTGTQVADADNSVKALPVASSLRIIGTSDWEHTYTYYDLKSRPAKTYKKNHLGGFTQITSTLDFRGKPLETETIHKRTPTGVEVKTKDYFTYDNMERLTLHKQSLGNSTVRNLIAENRYNRLGQLITKNVGGSHTGLADRWQEINYTYNIRGWLTNINNVSDIAAGEGATPPTTNDDLFAFQIRYQNPIAGADPLYNGNISQTFWKTASDNIQRGYSYTYDQLNRLRRADFYKQGNANITAYGEYISYDLNGNITNLVRNTGDASDNEIAMDDLGYAYENGTGNSNQLRNVKDFVTVGMSQGFYDGNIAPGVDDYEYDENGNMTVDRNKGITSITYNHLNLPTEIYWEASKKIQYLYNAAGQKLKKTVIDANTIKNVDYLDGFQYAGGVLQFFPHAEGYIKATPQSNTPNGEPTSYTYNYAFNYTDHLGNVRVSYSKDPATNQLKILEENHYYPFGLKHSSYDTGSKRDFMKGIDPGEPPVRIENVLETEYQYKYNGKELQDELGFGLYDYGWRDYDPAIGKWISPDPLSEEYPSWSPYNYALNNPIFFLDPNGLWVDDFIFDEKGDFVRIEENDQPDRLVIENSKTGARQNYSFADPEEDTQQIRDGIITKIVFVSESEIKDILSQQGAFNPENKDSWSHLYKESKGGKDYDYSYSVIPKKFSEQGASSSPLNKPSPMLFLPEGDYMAHNHMNFGNFLWGATGFTLGFSYSTLQIGAQANSLLNSDSNGYSPQLDTKDDQRSIIKGAYYADKNGFRQDSQKN